MSFAPESDLLLIYHGLENSKKPIGVKGFEPSASTSRTDAPISVFSCVFLGKHAFLTRFAQFSKNQLFPAKMSMVNNKVIYF